MSKALTEHGGAFLTAEKTMVLAFGYAYRASTVVYTGTSLLPPQRVIDHWNLPRLTLTTIEQRARKLMLENNVQLVEDRFITDTNRLFVAGCRHLVHPSTPFPIHLRRAHESS